MRIGFFSDAYEPIISGVSVSLNILKAELKKLGHEVFIFANAHDDYDPNEQGVYRMGGSRLPMKAMHEYRVGKVTRKKVRTVGDLNLDIIHCHTEFTMGRLGRRTAKKYNIPVVHTYHTMYEDYCHFISKTFVKPLKFASKIYSKSFANSADQVIFPTIKVKRTFERYGFKKEAHIIPTGIYLEQFRRINFKQQDLDEMRKGYGIKEDDFVMMFLGRMSREKSVQNLLRETKRIVDKYPNVKLLLVGGGPDLPSFQQQAKDLHIEKNCIFAGMVPMNDVGKYYQLGDLFVNFSVTETQGLTYIEALASGVPLLVKFDDNLETVIKNGVNGYSFIHDTEFVNLFEKIYNNKVLLSKITTNTNKLIESFSAETYAKKVVEVYKKALN